MPDKLDYIDYRRAWKPSMADLLAARAMQKKRSMHEGRFAHWQQEDIYATEDNSWLLTYMDLVTLLLVMMMVMLSFSEPAGFKPKPALASQSGMVNAAVAPGALPLSATGSIVPPLRPPHPLKELRVDQLGAKVEVIKGASTVRFRISSELLFASGDVGLTAEGLDLLDTLLPSFAVAKDYNIVVEGHADTTPINTVKYPSNWELSAGRAASVVRHLQTRNVQPGRLRAIGYADTRPIASNSTLEGQSANRRVELILELPRKDDE
jgi:chemotaxis protein MotB